MSSLPFPLPPSLHPSFRLSPATEADLDALVVTYYDAFRLDPGNTYWWSPERAHQESWMRRRMAPKLADRRVRHYKITDASAAGELVAWARWNIPAGYDARFGAHVDGQGDEIMEGGKNAGAEAETQKSEFPVGANEEFCREFIGAIQRMAEKWKAHEMLGLSLLCTAPQYHRRGAAKALILPMLDIADAAGLRTYLEATPTGKPVYEGLGFRTVEVVEFDLSKRIEGHQGVYKLSAMVREPKGGAGN
ncbi:hypothetical protein F4810DRAFT_225452 [Camillea tinctor]|nr:hypothetical protein F4810DRAFT_225452 [Camillea tinctor]